jgi:hypothetical protein
MLTKAQTRLETHFSSLCSERAALGYPVYALEHGMAAAEIDAWREALSHEIVEAQGLPIDHWLPWVVIAAEIGYAYDGEEYWTSFARAIPEWRQFGSRETIRSWFSTFSETYSGFRPHGRWTEQFSIIAWPIAHAILPRDMQGQFAKRLYDLRYDLGRGPELSIQDIGKLIRSNDPSGSSRFQNLLEQTELTGRLILALRDEDVQDAVPAINRPTLSRIVGDLERRQSARDWLREARKVLRDARIRGSADLINRQGVPEGTASGTTVRRAGGVKLVARQSSQAAWTLGIGLPDINLMLQEAGLQAKALDLTRVRFADRAETWMPGRALQTLSLTEQPIRSLTQLLGGPVLQLERDIPALSGLLSAELRISGSAPWILRVHEDGIARQVFGNHVRAGQYYIVVGVAPITSEMIRPLDVQSQDSRTPGIFVYSLKVPRVLQPPYLRALASLKIGFALRALIEPVGLVSRWEGSTGGTVWLVNEEPLLRLSADCPIKEFTVGIEGGAWTRIPMADHVEAIISLGALPIGPHVIEVSAIGKGMSSSGLNQRLEPERVYLEVRSPLPWIQGVRKQAGFRVELTPAGASLENLLKGAAKISVVGPPERSATVELRTYNINGHLAERAELGRVMLPADEVTLRRLVFKLSSEPLSEMVQSSPRVDLAFLVEELGVSSLSFHQKVRPLRWKLEAIGAAYRARLIDETGADQLVATDRYDICTPDRRVPIARDQCLAGLPIDSPGALLTAKFNGRHYPAVISVPEQATLTSLGDLGFRIALAVSGDTPRRIRRLTALHRLWGGARPLGPLGPVRKATVLRAFEHQIAIMLCGRNWSDRVRECLSGQSMLLDRLQREIADSTGFGARIRTTDWGDAADDAAVRAEFARLATTYRISDDVELCDLALLLAFNPSAVRFDNRDKGAIVFERLAAVPFLARGAFFARLVTDLAARELLATRAAA